MTQTFIFLFLPALEGFEKQNHEDIIFLTFKML